MIAADIPAKGDLAAWLLPSEFPALQSLFVLTGQV
jgi:hypothetical protein